METVITNDDRVAMAEVDYVIHHMNERYLNKIPQNVQDFIAILKKSNKQIYVDPRLPLERQGLKEFTLYFLMILNLKYWCDDARRKEILLMLDNNQKKYDNKINNIFNQAENMQGDSNKKDETNNLNKPKQVIVTGTPKSTNTIKVEVSNEENKVNVINQLEEETGAALAETKSEGFFKRIVNKIKLMLVKK